MNCSEIGILIYKQPKKKKKPEPEPVFVLICDHKYSNTGFGFFLRLFINNDFDFGKIYLSGSGCGTGNCPFGSNGVLKNRYIFFYNLIWNIYFFFIRLLKSQSMVRTIFTIECCLLVNNGLTL